MTDRFAIEVPGYKGPLETLLDLIEARKLSISEISLSEVADSYLTYVEKLPHLPLSETSQFVLIASTLLVIKSRSLLPTLDLTTDERESVEELERRLAQLKLIRAGAKILRSQWGIHRLAFPRRAPDQVPVFSPSNVSIEKLHRAMLSLINLLPKTENLTETVVSPVLALEDVISNLKKRLANAIRTRWSDLTRGANRHDSIVHFLAILELVRSGSVSAAQDKLFADIFIDSEITGTPSYGI
jgi:segregation and condensation protein A